MTIGELKQRLAELHAPNDATILVEDDYGRTFGVSFVHPPGWPGGGGKPTIWAEIEEVKS